MDHRIIDESLDVLRDKILLLGGATETAVQRAMQSLVERDNELARQVVDDDKGNRDGAQALDLGPQLATA